MSPTVTVIIPARNRERYIGEALASVLAQRSVDFEVVVVDDGSTDGTAARVAALADSRVRLLRGAHGGISAAMNRGLAAARGEYIGRCDSDDLWLPDLLATLVPVLERAPALGAVTARGETITAGGRRTGHLFGMAPRYPDSLCSLLWDDFTCNVATLARRSVVERAGGYDEALPTNEDWDLWLRVARLAPIAFVDRVLAHVRMHEANITGAGSPLFRQTIEGRARVLDKQFATGALPPAAVAMRADAYANVHLRSGLHWQAAGEHGRAWREFRAAMATATAPAFMALRIGWRMLSIHVLDRAAGGRRFLAWQSGLRGRWRARAARGW